MVTFIFWAIVVVYLWYAVSWLYREFYMPSKNARHKR